ncbi:hypothetical protein SteCoe_17408 [Stentor coeruleus]|uniref:Uncharacterized protein n=1 Tax=Stentor coeruleus TaxID=5963 RepID=A0A1R2BZ06_9CILI|nr:hypothetical protein SteCoe_17408 [Stentor coeruleus]
MKLVKVCNYCFAGLGNKRDDCDHYLCKDCDDKKNCKLCRMINNISIKLESGSSSNNHSPRNTLRNPIEEEEIKTLVEKTQININSKIEEGSSDTEIKNRETGNFPVLNEKDTSTSVEPKRCKKIYEEIKHEDIYKHEISEKKTTEKQVLEKLNEPKALITKERHNIKHKKERRIEGDAGCNCMIS